MSSLLLAIVVFVGSLIRDLLRSIKKFVVAAATPALVVLWSLTVSVALFASGAVLDQHHNRPQPTVVYESTPQVITPPPDPEFVLVTRFCGFTTDPAGVPMMVTSDGMFVLASGWHGNMAKDAIYNMTISVHTYRTTDNGNIQITSARTVHSAGWTVTYLPKPVALCGT